MVLSPHCLGLALLAGLVRGGHVSPFDGSASDETTSTAIALRKECQEAFDLIRHFTTEVAAERGVDWSGVESRWAERLSTVQAAADQYRVMVALCNDLQDPDAECARIGWERTSAHSPRWVNLDYRSPGLFLCRSGQGVYVKESFGPAERAGVPVGAEVLTLDGEPALLWLYRRAEALKKFWDLRGGALSRHLAQHEGLSDKGDRPLHVEFTVGSGPIQRVTLARSEGRVASDGVSFPSAHQRPRGPDLVWDWMGDGDLVWVHANGLGIATLSDFDVLLAQVESARGMALDLRGCDHGAVDEFQFLGRFVVTGQALAAEGFPFVSASSETSFCGPLVVLVDGGTSGAAETFAALAQRYGRAIVIGESETAGRPWYHHSVPVGASCRLSFSHRSLPSPSLRGVAYGSTTPDEVLQYRARDLRSDRPDSLRNRALELLLQESR